jgi:hypothetical protein
MCDCGCTKIKKEKVANKKGDRLECKECGLIILVENPCCCEVCNITCCGKTLQSI